MAIVDLPRLIATKMIKGYQYFLSPFFGQHCRFHPTCSNYAIEALERYGFLRGGMFALRRLGRCHPLNAGGLDPVPNCITDLPNPAMNEQKTEFRC